MKFSCDLNGINYTIETIQTRSVNPRFIFLLDKRQKKRLKDNKADYYDVIINAKKDDSELNFVFQGWPLAHNPETQMDDLEDFFESQCIFTKVELHFDLDSRTSHKTTWGEG